MYSEVFLYHYWEKLPLNHEINPGRGKLVILNRGNLSSNVGPDFQGVQLQLDSINYNGDMEIHLRSSDWYLHGHHLNPDYDNVILHLVWEIDRDDIRTHSGIHIRQISFRDLIHSIDKDQENGAVTDDLFFQRFARKVAYCDDLLRFHLPEDVFWILLARTLGYKRNSDTMELFARVFYPSRIRILYPHKGELEQFLRWVAYPQKSEKPESMPQNLPRLEIPWRKGGRPVNQPNKRIIYLAHLLEKWWYGNLFDETEKIIVERKNSRYVRGNINRLLQIRSATGNPGKERINIFLINWLLPLLYAVHNSDPGLQVYMLDLYWELPAEKIPNRLEEKSGKPENAMQSQCFYEWNEMQNGSHEYWLAELKIPYGV